MKDAAFWTATAVFAVSYILIITERLHRTVVAMLGAALMIALGVLRQREAFNVPELGVDWNVVFLLVSLMIIVNLMKPSGLFEYLAVKCAKLGRGEPFRILWWLALVTAIVSAVLDNVTTVLLIVPVSMFIADALEVDALPFLLAEVFASNIGGAATLIGDPPNIMIGSKAGLTFMDFIYNLTPAIILCMAGLYVMLKIFFGKSLKAKDGVRERIMAMDESGVIKDKAMVWKSIAVLALVLAGLAFQGALGCQPATVALLGAGILLLITGAREPEKALAEVEWPTIFFFIGLFIIVGGVVKVGLIQWMSVQMINLTRGSMLGASMLIMWFSALCSAVVDNIPYVAAMNPLVADMASRLWPGEPLASALHRPEMLPVWWSLALGACLGGNGTAVGASANVIVVGISSKAGRKISFMRFLAYGMPVMLMTVAVSTLYVWLRYYVF